MTITVTDEGGNSVSCTATVTLIDNEVPSILLVLRIRMYHPARATARPIPDLTDEVTADDNCTAAGNLTIIQSPAAGTAFSYQQVVHASR